MPTAGGSVRDGVDGLFVVSVATFALGLIMVMTGLMPPGESQDIDIPLMLGPGSRDTTAMVRPTDHIGAGSDRRTPLLAVRPRLHAPSQPSRPAASPPVHDARQECGRLDVDFTRCAYIRDSASVAHGYLVPRPSSGKVY